MAWLWKKLFNKKVIPSTIQEISPEEYESTEESTADIWLRQICRDYIQNLTGKEFSEEDLRCYIGSFSYKDRQTIGFVLDKLEDLINKHIRFVSQQIRENFRVTSHNAYLLTDLLNKDYESLTPDLRMARREIFQRYPSKISYEDLPDF